MKADFWTDHLCLCALSHFLNFSKRIIFNSTLYSLGLETEREDLPKPMYCVGGGARLASVSFSWRSICCCPWCARCKLIIRNTPSKNFHTRASPPPNILVTAAQLCLTLCTPWTVVHGILQARRLEWLPLPSPGDLPNPGIEPGSPALQADSSPSESRGKAR